jgi:hypothetical protein
MCRASACADAIPPVGEGRPLAAGPERVTSSHRRNRPPPMPPPGRRGPGADWKSASPGAPRRASACADAAPVRRRPVAPIGNRPPWALMCRASASADAIRLVGEGRPLAAGPGRVTSSHRRNRPPPTPPGRRGPIAPIGNRPPLGASRRASACADAAPVRRRPVAPIGNRPPWALMCRASASADAIRLVGEGRPLATGPERLTSSQPPAPAAPPPPAPNPAPAPPPRRPGHSRPRSRASARVGRRAAGIPPGGPVPHFHHQDTKTRRIVNFITSFHHQDPKTRRFVNFFIVNC